MVGAGIVRSGFSACRVSSRTWRTRRSPPPSSGLPAAGSDLDLDLDARRKFEFHQRVDRLGGRRVDVEDPLEGAELELLAGLLVDESRAVDRKNLLVRGQGHRAADNGARALHRLDDLFGRLVDQIVIE